MSLLGHSLHECSMVNLMLLMLGKKNIVEAVLLSWIRVSWALCSALKKWLVGSQPPVCRLVPGRGPGPTRKSQLGNVILNYKETGPQLVELSRGFKIHLYSHHAQTPWLKQNLHFERWDTVDLRAKPLRKKECIHARMLIYALRRNDRCRSEYTQVNLAVSS